MSRVLFALTLVAVAVTGAILASSVEKQLHEALMDVIMECNKTYTVPMSDITVANTTGNFSKEPKFKCMLRCILESLQMGNEEQGYDPMKMAIGMQMIRPARSDKSNFYDIAAYCHKRATGTGKCEKAFRYSNCMVQEELKRNGPL